MCKLKYDHLQDILQIIEKKYNPKKAEFYQLYSSSPLYVITENQKIIGLEFMGFKNFAADYYRARKNELGFSSQVQAEEFLRGSLYNLFKLELSENTMKLEPNKREMVITSHTNIKNNIKELCSA